MFSFSESFYVYYLRHKINTFIYLLLPALHSEALLLTRLFIQHLLCANCYSRFWGYNGDGETHALSALMEYTV